MPKASLACLCLAFGFKGLCRAWVVAGGPLGGAVEVVRQRRATLGLLPVTISWSHLNPHLHQRLPNGLRGSAELMTNLRQFLIYRFGPSPDNPSGLSRGIDSHTMEVCQPQPWAEVILLVRPGSGAADQSHSAEGADRRAE
jgi:hypothetical protein